MDVEGFLVGLNCLVFLVERLKESLTSLHAVGVPLGRSWGEKCVSNESFGSTAGGAAVLTRAGRTTNKEKRQTRDFDSRTKGYPGEDGKIRH